MRDKVLLFGVGIVVVLALSPSTGFSQIQAAQNRIPQQIVVNGQMASGAYVTAAGGQMQSFTCPSPQHYTTADGSSQGWACYEQPTGVWLLNAVPPSSQPQVAPPAPAPPVIQSVPQQPTVIYQQAPPTVVYPQAPPTVIYQAPPTVIYQQPAPTVVYAPAPSPVIVQPTYPSSVILGRAAIDAAGRIASAVIVSSHHSGPYRYYYEHDRDRGRRW